MYLWEILELQSVKELRWDWMGTRIDIHIKHKNSVWRNAVYEASFR